MDDDRLSISSDDPCFEAYFELSQGELETTISLLHDGAAIHPLLQRELARMLDRSHRVYDLRLAKKVRGAPKKSNAQSRRLDQDIKAFVGHRRSSEPFALEKQIIWDAAQKFGIRERGVYEAIERATSWELKMQDFLQAHIVADKNQN